MYIYLYKNPPVSLSLSDDLWSLICDVTKRYMMCNTSIYWIWTKEFTPIFFKWQIRTLTTHWNHLGFLISIPGVRNVLQSHEVFLIDAKYNFEDREKSNTSHCMYFKKEIHWCTQNHLRTSSSMLQEGYIRNILVQIYFSSCRNSQPISQSWMKESTPIMKSMVRDITLDPLGVPHLHPKSQKRPPKSRRGSLFCQNIL